MSSPPPGSSSGGETPPPGPSSSAPPPPPPPPPSSTTTSNTTRETSQQQPTSSAPPPPVTTSQSQQTTNTSPQSSQTSVKVITSGNVEVTQTVVIQPTFAPSPSQSNKPSGDKGFFQNTAAVAGTFTVVGLVALAGIIFLATMYMRKRRQNKLERENDEAAFEAATAPAPVFLDDDDDDRSNPFVQHHNYGPAAGAGVASHYTGNSGNNGPSSNYYSDTSHGTYAQQPMSPESYGMSEMSGGQGASFAPVGPGQIYNPGQGEGYGGAAGAAGIGVTRTRSMMAGQNQGAPQGDNNGYGLGDGNAPYAAFAGPNSNGNGQQHGYADPYSAAGVQRGPSGRSAAFNPYGATPEEVPPIPNPYDQNRQLSPPPSHTPAQPGNDLVNPHSPPPNEAPGGGLSAQQNRALAGVTSQGSFGSTPEYGHTPLDLHAAGQTGEQGRWSDYRDESEDEPGPVKSQQGHVVYDEEAVSDGESDDEAAPRGKVLKVANE